MRLAPAPSRSLYAAVLGSAALHALLLGAVWPRPHVASQSKVQVIEARLLLAPKAQVELPASVPAAPDALPLPVERPGEPIPQVLPRDAPALPAPAPPSALTRQPERPPPAEASSPAPAAALPEQLPAAVQPAAGAVASPASASVYLPASELDPPPRPLTDIRLMYPPNAGMRMGEVTLDLLIGTSGAVEDVKILEAAPPGLFEASAISAFVSTRFAPGMRAGVPAAARMRVVVQYSATGMVVSGTGASPQPDKPR